MLISLDEYYNVQSYNEYKEALINNKIQFKEFISSKPPFYFYFEVNSKPMFINYDEVPATYSKYLVSLTRALKPNDDYIYTRRSALSGTKALNFYAINDALRTGQKSSQGIFFSAGKDEILKLSKDYPRKIWFMGKYFNRKYKVFFTDNLVIRNFISSDQILIEGKGFSSVTELEAKLNFKIFKEKDRLEKLSQTPYILNGKFYPLKSIRADVTDKYILS